MRKVVVFTENRVRPPAAAAPRVGGDEYGFTARDWRTSSISASDRPAAWRTSLGRGVDVDRAPAADGDEVDQPR